MQAILKSKTSEVSPARLTFPRRMESEEETKPSVSCVVALFLLSQVFLIITHGPIVHALAWIILQSDLSIFDDGVTKILETYLSRAKSNIKLEFSKPQLSLEKALECSSGYDRDYTTPEYNGPKIFGYDPDKDTDHSSCDMDPELVSTSLPSTSHMSASSSVANESTEDLVTHMHSVKTCVASVCENMPDSPLPDSGFESEKTAVDFKNITDEEKQKILFEKTSPASSIEQMVKLEHAIDKQAREIERRPFLKTVFDSLDCSDKDYKALFALCLLYAMVKNKG